MQINQLFALLIGTFVVVGCSETSTNNNHDPIDSTLSEWDLVWSDEFDGDFVDDLKWNILLWGPGRVNDELQAYTEETDNIFIENGHLVIQALYQPGYTGTDSQGNGYTTNYTSGRLNTADKAEWTTGRFEINAKLPKGIGSWPAIWMLGSSISTVGWPACGEIDIMEHVGYDEGNIHASIHTTDYNHNLGTQKSGYLTVPTATNSFHVYALEWTSNYLYFMVDDTPYHFVYNDSEGDKNKWPFDENIFIILNVAVGGSWGGAQGIDNTAFPMQMAVDYVRVYEASDQHNDIDVTFQVNMTGKLVAGTGVRLSGGTIGSGQPGGIAMHDPDGDGIWSVTLSLPKGSVHTYKFRNGYYPDSWNLGWESVPDDCGFGQNNNRQFTVTETDTILPPVCFNECTDCD